MCGGPLTAGYVVANLWLAWSPKRARRLMPGDAVTLAGPGAFSGNFLARRCEACSLVLFRYDPEALPHPAERNL